MVGEGLIIKEGGEPILDDPKEVKWQRQILRAKEQASHLDDDLPPSDGDDEEENE